MSDGEPGPLIEVPVSPPTIPQSGWTDQEEKLALKLFLGGDTYKTIGIQLHRTKTAIHHKLRMLMSTEEQKQRLLARQRDLYHKSQARKLGIELERESGARSVMPYNKDTDQTITIMWHNDQYSTKEIATATGRTIHAVNTRASRLRLGARRKVEFSPGDDEMYSRAAIVAMDQKFCWAMKSAIEQGLEVAPTAIVTTPGTSRPRLMSPRVRLPARSSIASECADA